MFRAIDTPHAPWTVKSNEKRRARLEAIRSLLWQTPYDRKDKAAVGKPTPWSSVRPTPSCNQEKNSPTSPPWRLMARSTVLGPLVSLTVEAGGPAA